MNIAPSTPGTAPTTGLRPDGLTTGHILPDPGIGVDATAADGTTSAMGFGSLLSRHLDGARVADPAAAATSAAPSRGHVLDPRLQPAAVGADPAIAGDPTAAPVGGGAVPVADAVTPTAVSGVAAVVPAELFPTLATSTTAGVTATASAPGSSVQDAVRKDRPDDDATDGGEAGSDLAAQLALASQWTGVARPVETSAPATSTQATSAPVTTAIVATAAGGASSIGIDAKAALGKDRTPSGKDDANQNREAGLSADPGATVPLAPAGDAATADAGRHKDHAANAFVVATKDTAAKVAGDTASVTPDTAVPAATALVDLAAAGDLFGARLAAHGATANAALVGTSVGGASVATTAAANGSAATSASAAFAFVQEPVGSGGWSHQVGQAALRMAANDLQSASIRLNPEHLGPLDVQVRVDDGVAHLAFTATHADTRQALEASRGTLDQLFAGQGMKMGDVSVGAGSSGGSNDAFAARGDQSADASRREAGNRWSGDDAGADGDAPATTVTTRIARALGLVDTFA